MFVTQRQMDVTDRDRANRSSRSDDDPPVACDGLILPAAKHLHAQEAIRRGTANQTAKFIHVRVKHDPRTRITLARVTEPSPS